MHNRIFLILSLKCVLMSIYIVISYLLVPFELFLLSVFFVLLHSGSFCHENKFLVCVNIPGNKAHSDSDEDSMIFE